MPAVDLQVVLADSDVPKDARELRLVVRQRLRSFAYDDHDRIQWPIGLSGYKPNKVVSRKSIHSGLHTS
jgi:hypothetical protein